MGKEGVGKIENNFGGRERERERNAPCEIDGWLWCRDLWLIKNFPYDDDARAFFRLRSTSSCPALWLLFFFFSFLLLFRIFRFPFRLPRPAPAAPLVAARFLSYFPPQLAAARNLQLQPPLQLARRASEKKKNVSWVYS